MPMIRFMVLAMLVAVTSISNLNAQTPITLSGISVFNADRTATAWRSASLPDGDFKLFLLDGTDPLPLANTTGSNPTSSPISASSVLNGTTPTLPYNGNLTFNIVGNQNDPANPITEFGVNLFFNGVTTPAISAIWNSATGLRPYTTLSPTPNQSASSVNAALNALTWTDGNSIVTLESFSFLQLGNNLVDAHDHSSPFDTTRANDLQGSFTLSVVDSQAIPEPSSALLLLLASSGCVAYRRHKNNKKLSPELANA